MLLQGAGVIVSVETVHGRFQFINAPEEEPTMVARLPQQVLLLLVLVTGAAAEATREEESLWETHEARKGGRTTFAWSSSTERTTGETKSMGKFDRTTSSHADTSDSRETGSQGLVKAATTASPDGEEREERIEMRGNALPTSRESDTGKVKTSNGRYSTVASRSMDDTGRKINLSAGETFVQSTARRPSFDKNVVFTRNFDNIVATKRTKLSENPSKNQWNADTPRTKAYNVNDVIRRQMRHVPDVCDKFSVGDESKREFYSPNYPDNYPNLTECIKILKEAGVPPEPEDCVRDVSGVQAIISSEDVVDRKTLSEKEGIPLDCLWNITVKEGWKIQLTFSDPFKLQRPNECDANFVDVFKERTDMSSREKNFCGSIADTVVIGTNTAFVRFYTEPKALNSSFEAVMTALRDRDPGDKPCLDNEFYCEDATCIAAELQCNGRVNCRFRWDEEDQSCSKKKSRLIDSQHIVIILIVFSLIMFGMSFAFVFNCVRKLIRDHRIIQEHIRQSRENRLDELGRKATPCPISSSRTDIRDRVSDSPSLEVIPSKELLPPTTLIAQDYTKDLVLEMAYNTRDMHDIHQSNNVSNATQERLQESSDEPEMRDNSCQTRESLFETRIPDNVMPVGFTTFGVRGPSSQNGTNHLHYHRHHHLHHQSPPQSRQTSQPSQQSSEHSSQQQCSGCSPASRGRDGSMGICPKHNPIPAPPGWSTHESGYSLPPHQGSAYPEPPDYPSYQRFQSPKPSRENSVYRQSPKLLRQGTIGSGERYGSSIYGSGHGSSNASSTQHSATPKCPEQTTPDPRYRAEAVIEVDQRRPFSIESTKSAPDVIATH
ncbi:uncharacterized protein LOC107996135 isoform X4 [Apis cerana]|uniref:uncharacterized protein LOC107996135 isoform X4 n=1 Tax=Apis cerana TaxID=7461 RepID=UPI002B2343FA|nr:uncharacterized protein LOC107996135 isoform X4 [Apis cerana]